ncbi:hypothetical protein N0Y54_24105 [Nostoc punctiforme UO1]|uniref:hypothetical protein n=1 Tax=Nostoc punctiforme TaxID=272131 RepID=UPI00309C0504
MTTRTVEVFHELKGIDPKWIGVNSLIRVERVGNHETSEIQVVQDLITAMDLQGVVFSFDSLHCQKKLVS